MTQNASDIITWTVEVGLEGLGPAGLLAGYCDRLSQAGVPLWRASVGTEKLHPLIDAQGHRWVVDVGTEEEVMHRIESEEREEEWRQSPWFTLLEDHELRMRRRLATGEGCNEYPLLSILAEQGATDYWARVVEFGEHVRFGTARGIVTSWTTCSPGGFSDQHIAIMEATLPAFALAFKATNGVETARTLVTTYLGRDPGARILRGEIERGEVTTERKVLWFSDLADFTRIADSLPRDQLLDLLNAYADCLVGIVHDHGGDVLKFMGDGILAVFRGPETDACRAALDAAEKARSAVDRLNRERSAVGRPTTGFTLALHEGEVFYGNIGSRDRLDFTVIGPAVNEASRILAMSRSLDQPILVSASFAVACGQARGRLVSVGRYALRGVGQPQELFTVDPAVPGAA